MALRNLQKLAAGAVPNGLRSISTYSLPDLPYSYSALEPVISAQIMELHHKKHHAAYVANLNKGLEQYAEAEAKKDVAKMIALQGAIKFNGGGGCLAVSGREGFSAPPRVPFCCCRRQAAPTHVPPLGWRLQATSTTLSSGRTCARPRYAP